MRTLLGILLLQLIGCGGSEKKETAPPPPPKEAAKPAEPPPTESQPAPEPPPPPDPREGFTLLLGALKQEVENLKQMPFSDWGNGIAGIINRDADLQGFIEELPGETSRIDRLRKNAAALNTW